MRQRPVSNNTTIPPLHKKRVSSAKDNRPDPNQPMHTGRQHVPGNRRSRTIAVCGGRNQSTNLHQSHPIQPDTPRTSLTSPTCMVGFRSGNRPSASSSTTSAWKQRLFGDSSICHPSTTVPTTAPAAHDGRMTQRGPSGHAVLRGQKGVYIGVVVRTLMAC